MHFFSHECPRAHQSADYFCNFVNLNFEVLTNLNLELSTFDCCGDDVFDVECFIFAGLRRLNALVVI